MAYVDKLFLLGFIMALGFLSLDDGVQALKCECKEGESTECKKDGDKFGFECPKYCLREETLDSTGKITNLILKCSKKPIGDNPGPAQKTCTRPDKKIVDRVCDDKDYCNSGPKTDEKSELENAAGGEKKNVGDSKFRPSSWTLFVICVCSAGILSF